MFKNLINTAVATLLVANFAWAQFGAGDTVAVLNSKNPTSSVSADLAKDILLGNHTFWQKVVKIKLYLRPAGTQGAEAISSVSGLGVGDLDSHWTSKQLAGAGVKPSTVSLDDIAAKIGAEPGAFTLVSGEEANSLSASGLKLLPVK